MKDTSTMLWLLEYSDKQGCFHQALEGNKRHRPNTNGFKTLGRRLKDKECSQFCDYAEVFFPDVWHEEGKSGPTFMQVKMLFDLWQATELKPIEVNSWMLKNGYSVEEGTEYSIAFNAITNYIDSQA